MAHPFHLRLLRPRVDFGHTAEPVSKGRLCADEAGSLTGKHLDEAGPSSLVGALLNCN